MNFTKMEKKRYGLIRELVGFNKKVLDLGDVNNSNLAVGLRNDGNEVLTLSMTKGSTIKCNLDEGMPKYLNNRFDVVVAGELFEHIYFLNNLLQGIKRLLKPDGCLVLSVPNLCSLKSMIKVLFGYLPTYCADGDKFHDKSGYTGHIRDFNVNEIIYYLKNNGWVINDLCGAGLWVRGREVIPSWFCPVKLGDCIIIKAKVNIEGVD